MAHHTLQLHCNKLNNVQEHPTQSLVKKFKIIASTRNCFLNAREKINTKFNKQSIIGFLILMIIDQGIIGLLILMIIDHFLVLKSLLKHFFQFFYQLCFKLNHVHHVHVFWTTLIKPGSLGQFFLWTKFNHSWFLICNLHHRKLVNIS